MKILNFGSLNIDHVYAVDHFVKAGETVSSVSMERHVGGKGLNQSVALARAGAKVFHAGRIGEDGRFLVGYLDKAGVDTSSIEVSEQPTGNAVIQVDKSGQNCILLCPGANMTVCEEMIDRVLSKFGKGDMIVLQNEISSVGIILEKAKERGLVTVLNPSPVSRALCDYPLNLVDWFILNEIEGKELTGKSDPCGILSEMFAKYPRSEVVLTLGEKGAIYGSSEGYISVPAEKCRAVDTTAAGDTFTGYFFASIAKGKAPYQALKTAAHAAAIAVTRKGAAESIPCLNEL